MGRLYAAIDEGLRAFIERQPLFFVATAPDEGHLNCSPKGRDALRIIGPRSVAYLDYVGSGAETIAHTRANGRIVVMFCAFEGPPKIVRLHGRARVIEPHDEDFAALLARFIPGPAVRSIILIECERISDSCGYGVPLMRYESERPQMAAWAERKGDDGIAAYQREKNAESIDGLPALRFTDRD